MNRDVRVLILDDDDDDIFLVEDAIDDIPDSRYKVSSTRNPVEADAILQAGEADIVLCDHFMGSTTGIEFITEQRDNGIQTPIILLTGLNDRSTDEAALKAGASDFLSKVNLSSDLLDRSIRYALANAERKEVLQTILENVNAGVALIGPDMVPTIWNPEFEAQAGYAKEEPGVESIESFVTFVLRGNRIINLRDKVLEKRVSYTSDQRMVLLLQDVTEHFEALREREAAKNRAAHLAMNCTLTGLPNRNSFAEKIESAIEDAVKNNKEFFLLNMDLNKFKEVNDVYGHKTGDHLLREVAMRFSSVCEEGEFLARLGGDEFVAIQPVDGESKDDIPSMAGRLLEVMSEDLLIDGLLLNVGVSVGVARFPEHGQTAEELLSKADIAMYRAKNETGEGIHAFNEELDRKIREARLLGQELTKAVENGDIEVHFQPQMCTDSGKIIGFEALARWNHPSFGPISPTMFIPLAEERGLISKLGLFVLRRACELAAEWPEPLKVAVNVSPVQIRDTDLIEKVHEALMQSGLSPSRLELEITESVLIDDQVRALHMLRGLKNLGVAIALDDFGTGFSSLSTLISFPFDKIKIDRSFVEDCGKNTQAALVTRTIIRMGIQLGCSVIAEGVQKTEHIDFLQHEGCHFLQGFLIGKPCANTELEQYFYESSNASKLKIA